MSSGTLVDAAGAGTESLLAASGMPGMLEPSLTQVTAAPSAAVPDSTGISSASEPSSTLVEETPDAELAPAESAASGDATSGDAVQVVVASLSVSEAASPVPATDITGPDSTEPEAVSFLASTEVPGGLGDEVIPAGAVESGATEAPIDSTAHEASNAASDSAAAMAMIVDDGDFGGAMVDSSLVCGGCWGDVTGDGQVYYDDRLDWYTKPYVIGDGTGDIFVDILPLPVEDDALDTDESEDWVYSEELGDWVYVGDDEDGVAFDDENEDWFYDDEDRAYVVDDWSYTEDGEDSIYADEEEWYGDDGWEDWDYTEDGEIYLNEWEDTEYTEEVPADGGEDEGYVDEDVYVDGDVIDVNSDPDLTVCVCWGYAESVDESDLLRIEPTASDVEPVDAFTASVMPLAASDLFIA